jgi:hypothetical protein
VLAGNAGVVDGVADAELEARVGLVGAEEESVTACMDTRSVVLTCLKGAEGERCPHRVRGSQGRPYPTCACV